MFIERLQCRNVTLSQHPALMCYIGFFFWAATLALYVTATVLEDTLPNRTIWIIDSAIHFAVGIMVVIEACYTQGLFWPFATAIIGCASFVTFTLASLVATYLINDDTQLLCISLGALGAACFGNGMMLAIIFEYHNRCCLDDGDVSSSKKATNKVAPSPQTSKYPSSRT